MVVVNSKGMRTERTSKTDPRIRVATITTSYQWSNLMTDYPQLRRATKRTSNRGFPGN